MAKRKPRAQAKGTSDIELRPHVGVMSNGNEVTFAQDQIFVGDVRYGYIGHQSGAAIVLIRPVDDKMLEAIKSHCEKERHEKPVKVVTARPIEDDNTGSDDE